MSKTSAFISTLAAFGMAIGSAAAEQSIPEKAMQTLEQDCNAKGSIDELNFIQCIETIGRTAMIIASETHVAVDASEANTFNKDMAIAMLNGECHAPFGELAHFRMSKDFEKNKIEYLKALFLRAYFCNQTLEFIGEVAGKDYFPKEREAINLDIRRIDALMAAQKRAQLEPAAAQP